MAGRRIIVVAILCIAAVLAVSVSLAVGFRSPARNGGLAAKAAADTPSGSTVRTVSGDVVVANASTGASVSAVSTMNSALEIEALQRMELMAENELLMLYMDRITTEIAVRDKRDGYVWFSNPAAKDDDAKASPRYKAELSSQLILTYYNNKGQTFHLNSYDDSVKNEQFAIHHEGEIVTVIYELGTAAKKNANIPKAISKQRFEELILNRLDDEDMREDVEFKFRLNKDTEVYELRQLSDHVAEQLAATLEAIGYTQEEATADHLANGVEEQTAASGARFVVPVRYKLEGEHLLASIQLEQVEYMESYPLAAVELLKYFGAADSAQEGYLLVPDGSGALIHLNNGKLQAEPYQLPLYGQDGAFDMKQKLQSNESSRLPVFGLKHNEHALLGMIEYGDALASVAADISGRHHSYNHVYSKYQIVAMDAYTLTSGTKSSSVPMFQRNVYKGDIQVRYAFFSGAAANYVGMAAGYRDYLVNRHELQKVEPASDIPFVLQLEGAFLKEKSFLGIPYESTESLTDYAEAQELLTMLKLEAIDHIALRYVGWFNDGIRHKSPAKVSLEPALGGKRKFRELTEYTQANEIGFYPDVALLHQYMGAKDAAYFLDRRKAAVYAYDPVTRTQDFSRLSHYIVAASKLPGIVDSFLHAYTSREIAGVSLRDLGDAVHSDFNPKRSVSRQDALNSIVQEAAKVKQQIGQVMVNGGNAYMLPYADLIVNAPVKSSRTNLADEDIPFYQIVLHGYVDYVGSPFNDNEVMDPRQSLLKALETGSGVYYQWFYREPSVIKDTSFNYLYSHYYKNWFDEAVHIYHEANAVLRQVRDQLVVGHRKLADGVYETIYENGQVITVNYNEEAVQVNGNSIAAQSYLHSLHQGPASQGSPGGE